MPFAEHLAATFERERRTRHRMFSDVEAFLKNIHQTVRLALITNSTPDLQQHKIREAHPEKYFEAIIISGEVGIGKSNPQIFALVLSQLGASSEVAVMLGDSLNRDILEAQRAGLKGIWVNRSRKDSDQEIIPYTQITTLSELCNVLE